MARYIEKEPIWLSEIDDMENVNNRSSIPQGLDFERKIVDDNNVELNSFEKVLQDIGIIPSDAWISGKSRFWFVNMIKNIGKELTGAEEETEIIDRNYIIDLPMDNLELDRVDTLKPTYEDNRKKEKEAKKDSSVKNFRYNSNRNEVKGVIGLGINDFYSEDVTNENLDIAPSTCEIYR